VPLICPTCQNVFTDKASTPATPATLHGVVFDILAGRECRVGLAAGKWGLPSRGSRAAPAFAQLGFGAAAFTRFASEGWWTRPAYVPVRKLSNDARTLMLIGTVRGSTAIAASAATTCRLAFLASHLLWMTKQQEIVAMNLGNYGLEVGCAADLVVLDQQSVAEVLCFRAPPAAVISHGRLVDAKKVRELAQPGPG
jgi:hypothetical protein